MSCLRDSNKRLTQSSSSGSSNSDSSTESSDAGFPSTATLAAEEAHVAAYAHRISCINEEGEDVMTGDDIYNGELGTKQYIFFFLVRFVYE